MSIKTKAFIYNFIGFALIFIGLRLVLTIFILGFTAVLIAGILAIVCSPKFAVGPSDKGEQLYVKWVFLKGLRKVNF